MEAPRPQARDAALFLLIVALPLAFFPLAVQPFSDLKLVLLLLGTLLLFASGTTIGRRLRWPAIAWVLLAAVATALGTDPIGGLVGPWEGTGLLLLVACDGLAVTGSGLGDLDVERMRTLLLGSAAGVAGVAVAWRLWPSAFQAAGLDVSFLGSTIGNPVFVAIFLACALPALIRARTSAGSTAAAILFGFAIAANGERSALALPIAATLLCLWLLPRERRRTLLVAGLLALSATAWAVLEPGGSGLGATEAQFETMHGEAERAAAFSANARAFLHRPVLGWGPGLTWGGFVRWATPSELETAGRGWKDAHDLPLEMFVSTGVLGGLAFSVLAALLVIGLARAPADRRGLAVSAIVLGLGSLYEPLNLSTTPLLFLFAAAAYPEPVSHGAGPRAVRVVAIGVLAAATVLAGLALGASALEQWGRTHFAEWSIRTSLALQPGRLSAQERLAIELALDGRASDVSAAAEARATIQDAVEQHPWDPNVRLTASDVERLLKDFDASAAWLDRQAERFPNEDLSKSRDDASPFGG